MFEAIREQGHAGSNGRVSAFVRRWHEEQAEAPRKKAYAPLAFPPPGEIGVAGQFSIEPLRFVTEMKPQYIDRNLPNFDIHGGQFT